MAFYLNLQEIKLFKFQELNLGMTLIELIIVLCIIAVLTGVTVPVYTHQVIKARRADGFVSLLDLTTKMERYYAQHQSYLGATIGPKGNILKKTNSPKGFYTLNITTASANTYELTAIPIGPQKKDTQCGALSINALGQEAISGTGTVSQCWG